MKLSPTQLRVLRYASEGRLRKVQSIHGTSYCADGEAFDYGDMKPLSVFALVRHRDDEPTWRKGVRRIRIEVTPKGAALLEEEGEA